jgi:hypothetical protein
MDDHKFGYTIKLKKPKKIWRDYNMLELRKITLFFILGSKEDSQNSRRIIFYFKNKIIIWFRAKFG